MKATACIRICMYNSNQQRRALRTVQCLAVLFIILMPAAQQPSLAKTTTALRSAGMTCNHQTLKPGDWLILDLPLPHGKEMGIEAPNGDFYDIAFEDNPTSSFYHPIVPSAIFSKKRKLKLAISSLKGLNAWHQGEAPTRVFTQNGRYKISVSDSFDTDNPVEYP